MSLYRSWMFVPGNHERRLEKSKTLSADVILYDLEDAVALSEKENARIMVQQALKENGEKRNYIRVNAPSTPYYFEDVHELVCEQLTGIVLPKSAKPEHIQNLDHLLTQMEKNKEIAAGSLEIVPLIESALGLYNAYEIASTSERVNRLAFGSVDFTLDINAQLTKEGIEILYARSQLVVASRAADIEPPIDAVYVHIKDHEGMVKDTRMAKQLGFQGKLVIHPNQIEVVNEEFAPKEDEIKEAKEIISAFKESSATGMVAIQVNGKMVDYPVVERAKKIMEQARVLGL